MAELGPGSPRGGENSPLDFIPSRGDPNPHHGLFSRCAQISSGSASSRLRINLKPARSLFSVLPGPPDWDRCLLARRRPRTFKPKLTRSPGPAEGAAHGNRLNKPLTRLYFLNRGVRTHLFFRRFRMSCTIAVGNWLTPVPPHRSPHAR